MKNKKNTIIDQKLPLTNKAMNPLKILFLSLLTLFLLPVQNIFAQIIQTTEDKIFTKFLCKDDIAHPYCLFTNINLPL